MSVEDLEMVQNQGYIDPDLFQDDISDYISGIGKDDILECGIDYDDKGWDYDNL